MEKPKIGSHIQYSGYVMHNGSFFGFDGERFEVINQGPESKRNGIIHVSTIYHGERWEGWIPQGAYSFQCEPRELGICSPSGEYDALRHPSWRKHLKGD